MPRSGCIWHIVSLWGCSRGWYRWGRGAGLRQYRPGGSCPRYLRRSRCSCFCKNNNVNLSRCEEQKPSRAEYCTKCVERLKSWMVSLKVMQYMPHVMSHPSWTYSPPTQNWSPKNWSLIGYNYHQNDIGIKSKGSSWKFRKLSSSGPGPGQVKVRSRSGEGQVGQSQDNLKTLTTSTTKFLWAAQTKEGTVYKLMKLNASSWYFM